MFYSQLILAKKGPLGTIWIAAHLERKLRKNQVTETNISVSVDSILFPEAPIALRLSGHLLLGVVRIYSRKVNYLFHDCSEALTKIKQAFHAGAVDLPPESTTAPFHAITLPENFDLDQFEPLGERESLLLAGGAVDQHVTTRELITLQDTHLEEDIYSRSQFGLDDRLPQAELPRMGLDFEEEREKEAQEREQSPRLTLEEEVAPSVEGYRIDFDRLDEMEAMDIEHLPPMTPAPPAVVGVDLQMEEHPEEMQEEMPEELEQLAPMEQDRLVPVEEEVVAVEEEAVAVEEEAVAVEEREELIEVPEELVPALEAAAEQLPAPVSPAPLPLETEEVPEVETLRAAVEALTEEAPDLFAFERETARASEGLPARDVDQPMVEAEQPLEIPETMEELQEISVPTAPTLTSPRRRPSPAPSDLPADDDVLATLLGGRPTPSLRVMPTPSEEGISRRPRRAPKPPNRKRKPVFDAQTILTGDQMREQLADTSDIRRVRKKAPSTQRELWMVERLAKGSQVFNEPSIPGLGPQLRELFTRMLVPGRPNLPLAEPRREVTPEPTREDVPAIPQAEAPVEEPRIDESRMSEPQPEEPQPMAAEPAAELVEELGLELPVIEPPAEPVDELEPAAALELPAEVQPEQIPEAIVPTEEVIEFPVLETEPEAVSEPQMPLTAPAVEPVPLETEAEEEVKEETPVQEAAPEFLAIEEEVEVTQVRAPAIGEGEAPFAEEPALSQEVAAEAEAVAVAVAEGTAVVIEGVDGRTLIVLEDDGTIIDEGPSSFPVKEEIVGEEVQQEELGFLGEPRETVFLQDDDDDLNEEPESYDVLDVTVEQFSGWSARTRAVGGYLQGVFESLGAATEGRPEDQPRVGLDHTLRGKTRKEAARMFFETLVLKTKDYVDVEQPQPYGEVYLSARPKLLKGNF